MRAAGARTRCLALLAACFLAPSRSARANGAFPDAQALWWDQAGLVLSTNFGLVRQDATAGTWTWTCELGLSANGVLYGENGARRLFTLGAQGLAYSDDQACTWHAPLSADVAMNATDYFPDPTDASRVWLIAANTLQVSRDGGDHFAVVTSAPDPQATLSGVENAVADPSFVVVLTTGATPAPPLLGVSRDGGASFVWSPLASLADSASVKLVGLDRQEPTQLYLRVSRPSGDEELAVITGAEGRTGSLPTITTPVVMAGSKMSAFVQRADGTLLVTGNASTGPWAFVSRDHGATFVPWDTGGIHVKALAEKDGSLYAAADQLLAGDPFVVASHDDLTGAWHPLLSSFRQTTALAACGAQACEEACASYVDFGLFAPALCQSVSARDGGQGDGSDARSGSPSDGGPSQDGGTTPREAAGCGCVVAPAPSSSPALDVLGLLVLHRRRRPRLSERRAADR